MGRFIGQQLNQGAAQLVIQHSPLSYHSHQSKQCHRYPYTAPVALPPMYCSNRNRQKQVVEGV